MKISKEKLLDSSNKTGFKPEILEKVWLLMDLLDAINKQSYLKDRLVLKGGTALNLFLFQLPRLSVDIDLNYIGHQSREGMAVERPKVEKELKELYYNMGMQIVRAPQSHAGSKWSLVHQSALSSNTTLEVDLNYMYRVPLWAPQKKESIEVAEKKTKEVSVLTPEELSTGKLSALFSRKASRDLFDAHYLLHKVPLDKDKLRAAVIIYGIMGPRDFREVSLNDINFDKDELNRKLIPVLKKNEFSSGVGSFEWAEQTAMECRHIIKDLINFNSSEKAFLDEFYDNGKIVLSKIIDDSNLIKNVEQHPLIKWRTQVLTNRVQLADEKNVVKI